MARRLIETTVGPKGTVKTYYDSDWQEYVSCMKQESGVDATYHTEDRRDALNTALHMVHGETMAQHILANEAQQEDDSHGDD